MESNTFHLLLWKLISQFKEVVAMRLAPTNDDFEWDDAEPSCSDEEVIYIDVGFHMSP